MQLIAITPPTSKLFINVAVQLYQKDANWIRPLDKDINDIFDDKKNKAFRFGSLQRWVLQDNSGKLLGRIAAFVNSKYKNKGDEMPVGGMGFFECTNNQDAANLLLDTAKKWLQDKGMQAMDGPINFGERDKWWGLVTSGFQEPLYCMNYNPPYYRILLENYGFKVFYNQVCFGMQPKSTLSEKIWQRHAEFAANPVFSSAYVKKNNFKKFAADFAHVYNAAWAGHGGQKEISTEQVLLMFKKMKPVMDEKILWFIYENNTAIGLFVNLPDINQWFKHLDGQFGFIQKLKFLFIKASRPNKKFVGLVFGIVPQWQGKGADAYLIGEACKGYIHTKKSPYIDFEMQWIGDFNPKMLNVAGSLGNVAESRRLSTYRYLFDREKAFKPHPVLI
ncbi:MAG: hypothetical protein IPO46_07860 [Chitinophagaceae bacterium]|jgi:hypothetical protein|nr:hypothetical protein [Chitinophagaceae bacterium]MBP6047508.1 hypothetical protein [Ferruginibacter sp.]NMD29077.1 hypothetical protein [Bacteroidota bacterium]MBK7088743.1 hypothetical protein [Chitinophagaceae bacterium]MBK7348071.1 hypothetical protein [Chitinophagaceae bacterium]